MDWCHCKGPWHAAGNALECAHIDAIVAAEDDMFNGLAVTRYGRARAMQVEPGLFAACFQGLSALEILLQLKSDELLSNLAFDFNMRPYAAVRATASTWRTTSAPACARSSTTRCCRATSPSSSASSRQGGSYARALYYFTF